MLEIWKWGYKLFLSHKIAISNRLHVIQTVTELTLELQFHSFHINTLVVEEESCLQLLADIPLENLLHDTETFAH